MKAYYVSPMKQEIHENWRKFATRHLVPHTQTCANCSMVIEIKSVKELDTNYANTYFRFDCPGCGSGIRFTGGEHLPDNVIGMLAEKHYNGTYELKGFFRHDHPEEFRLLKMTLITIIALIITMMFM